MVDLMIRAIKTLPDLPFQIAERFPQRTILCRCRSDGLVEISGGELFEQIGEVGLGVCAFRLATGDRVAVIADSRPEWFVTDWRCWQLAALQCPCTPRPRQAEMNRPDRQRADRACPYETFTSEARDDRRCPYRRRRCPRRQASDELRSRRAYGHRAGARSAP
jgi:hypothetical protein